MKAEDLTVDIIDKEKQEISKTPKKIVATIVTLLVLITLYFPKKIELSIDPIYIQGILLLFTAMVSSIGIAYYFKTPSKGKITLSEESIMFKRGKEKINFSLFDKTKIYLSEFLTNHDEMIYLLELVENNKKYCFELDIVFSKEKELLNKLKDKWCSNNANIEIINTPYNKRSPNPATLPLVVNTAKPTRCNRAVDGE